MIPNRREFIGQIGAASLGFGLVPTGFGQASGPAGALPRSIPEAEGVSPAGIESFLKAIDGGKHELHSLMILRHGKVIAEGWWQPYRPEFNHGMYSMSKSFTSTAVGLAVAEKRLSVNDRVISFFPGDLPDDVSDHLKMMTVKHLLTMSDGQKAGSTGKAIASDDWVKNFLAQPLPNRPGMVFSYNSASTYMLSAIVQKLTGQTVLDYLKPRLFQALGIDGMSWETCPQGINTGGWGLHIRTEGLAHLGQLYLQKGLWNSQRILPAGWVEEATAKQIQQPKNAKSNPDWVQGYGYQFWRCRHGLYRGDGAFGQFTIVLPKQDAVIVMTGESPGMQGELDLVYEHLLPAFGNGRDVGGGNRSANLRRKLKTLAVKMPSGKTTSPVAKRISGKQFELADNNLGIESVSFRFQGKTCRVTLKSQRGKESVACGNGDWRLGTAFIPEAPPRIIAGGAPKPGTEAPIAAAGAWQDENTYVMHWRYYETPHHDTVTCKFDGKTVSIGFLRSIIKIRGGKMDPRPVLLGRAA
jgi:hypothetical protein